jgi:hypothetical protein
MVYLENELDGEQDSVRRPRGNVLEALGPGALKKALQDRAVVDENDKCLQQVGKHISNHWLSACAMTLKVSVSLLR